MNVLVATDGSKYGRWGLNWVLFRHINRIMYRLMWHSVIVLNIAKETRRGY